MLTELELVEEHIRLAKALLNLRISQQAYDHLYGPGTYKEEIRMLSATVATQIERLIPREPQPLSD